jgi:hypothetical protein
MPAVLITLRQRAEGWIGIESLPVAPGYVLPQHVVDFGLIAATAASRLEPGDNVGIEPDRHRLFDWTEKGAAPRQPPIRSRRLANITRIDCFIRQCRQACELPFSPQD